MLDDTPESYKTPADFEIAFNGEQRRRCGGVGQGREPRPIVPSAYTPAASGGSLRRSNGAWRDHLACEDRDERRACAGTGVGAWLSIGTHW